MGGVPEIRFAKSGSARLAYQVFGDGPATLVAVPPFAQNIELGWESPVVRRFLDGLGSFSRCLIFDKRGTGASDRRSDTPGIDERVDDLRAVMDHAGIGRADLMGVSEGGPMAILFAATYPDRVGRLILNSTAARMMRDDQIEVAAAFFELFAAGWGTSESMTIPVLAPSAAHDSDFRTWFPRYERHAATPQSIRDLYLLYAEFDVRDAAPRVDCPVLMIHTVDDVVCPVALARETAALFPNARLVELPGADHFTGVGSQWASLLREVEQFITGRTRTTSVPPVRHHVQVRTLGRFAVTVDGREVPATEWGSRRARTLCKRLIAAEGHPLTRDELCDLLWPDEPDSKRLGARLSVQLSAVRRVLHGGVVADRSTVRLDPAEVTTDLSLLFGEDEDTALRVYDGEFLPEDRYEDWVVPIRQKAQARFVAAAHRRLAELEALGRFETLVPLTERVLAADPYDEPAHTILIKAHHRAGYHGLAAAAHRRYADAMHDLGVPSSDLDQIVTRA